MESKTCDVCMLIVIQKLFLQLIVNGLNGKAGLSAQKHVVGEVIRQNEQLFRKHPTVENIA